MAWDQAVKQAITNLSKGELGPELLGRIDTPQYLAGVKRARNFIVQKYGGMAFRPGFRFVAEADDVETPMRYVSFDFGIDASYMLAFQDLAFRPMSRGGMVLEDNLEILDVTIEAQTVVEIAYHELEIGDRFFISGATGMTELNGQFGRVVAVIDPDHVRLDINTIGMSAFTGSDGDTRVGSPPPPPPPPAPPPPPPPPPSEPSVGGGGGQGGDWGYNGLVNIP